MENFIVSARKYRPATFDTVVGQSYITTTLKNALKNNHLAQAFLFCGPRGVGKTTCARILAKTINCLTPTADYEACGTCDSCSAFQKNGSLNIYELDAASNNSVDDIRNLVDQVRFPPQTGTRKVYIIDEVHMLSTAAFNAFLKTLEEPPSYVIFILATTEKHKIIPTILSRCQIFDFKRIEVRDMAEHLQSIAQKESIQAEYDALELIAQKADGGLRDALSMFDMIATFSFEGGINYQTTLDNLHILDYDYYFRMTDALWKQQIGEVYIILDDILRRGFDGHNFIVGLAKHFRDLLVCKDPKTLKLLEVTEKVKGQYAEQAQIVSASFLLSAMNIAAQCDLQYKSSKQPRLHVELSLNKMAFLNSVLNWNTLNAPANAESEKKNLTPDTNIQPSSYKPAAIKSEVKENSAIQYQNGTVQTAKIPTKLEDLAVAAAEKPLEQNKPFDAEDVRAVFEFYKKVQKDYQAHKVLNRGAELLADFVLKFKIEQEELSLFQGFEADLLSNFRKRLANQAITFQVEIFKEEVIRRVYTNHDKFDYLAEKHPALLALQNALGLEIDN